MKEFNLRQKMACFKIYFIYLKQEEINLFNENDIYLKQGEINLFNENNFYSNLFKFTNDIYLAQDFVVFV